jgi:hypothetical protein
VLVGSNRSMQTVSASMTPQGTGPGASEDRRSSVEMTGQPMSRPKSPRLARSRGGADSGALAYRGNGGKGSGSRRGHLRRWPWSGA